MRHASASTKRLEHGELAAIAEQNEETKTASNKKKGAKTMKKSGAEGHTAVLLATPDDVPNRPIIPHGHQKEPTGKVSTLTGFGGTFAAVAIQQEA